MGFQYSVLAIVSGSVLHPLTSWLAKTLHCYPVWTAVEKPTALHYVSQVLSGLWLVDLAVRNLKYGRDA